MCADLHDSEFAALLESLNETHSKLATLTNELAIGDLRWKRSEAEFSVLENLCHLRDLEVEAYTPRIVRLLEEHDPVLPDFDGARVAAESDYNSQHAGQALQTFESARRENVSRLRSLSAEQLQRTATLEHVGTITLRRLAEMMQEHDEGHIEDLRLLRQRFDRERTVPEQQLAVESGSKTLPE